jgi:hypothetical protein
MSSPRTPSAGLLDSFVGRIFFYHQIYRLRPTSPDALTENAGLYGVFQLGELLGQAIDGLRSDTLRCVKIGKSEKSVRGRIREEYFGTSQRAAIPRRLVGDALIGRAISAQRTFAGFASDSLCDIRELWNSGASPSEAIRSQSALAQKFSLLTSRDVTQLESPVEDAVTAYMNNFRFIGISAEPEDLLKIEDAANSLLRDVAELDPPSSDWLGKYSSRDAVRIHGLWATVGVTKKYLPYATHECDSKRTDDRGRTVADWLFRLGGLIDKEMVASH